MKLDKPSVRRMREAVHAVAVHPDGDAASTYCGNTGDDTSLGTLRGLDELLQRAQRVEVTLHFGEEEGAEDVVQVRSGSNVVQTAHGRNITQVANVRGKGSITQVAGDINIGGV